MPCGPVFMEYIRITREQKSVLTVSRWMETSCQVSTFLGESRSHALWDVSVLNSEVRSVCAHVRELSRCKLRHYELLEFSPVSSDDRYLLGRSITALRYDLVVQ